MRESRPPASVPGGRGGGCHRRWAEDLDDAEEVWFGDEAEIELFGPGEPPPYLDQLRERRYLDLTRTPDGWYVLNGYLDPESGARLRRAIDLVLEAQDAARCCPSGGVRPPSMAHSAAGAPSKVTEPPSEAEGPGRNDPCPCASGQKHKRCCGGR